MPTVDDVNNTKTAPNAADGQLRKNHQSVELGQKMSKLQKTTKVVQAKIVTKKVKPPVFNAVVDR